MPNIQLETNIIAPVEVCFDLSRSINFDIISTKHTGERAIAGVTTGLIGFSESVTYPPDQVHLSGLSCRV